jgi:hypothetical protein
MLEGALLWLTRQAGGASDPRRVAVPTISAVGNAATGEPRNTVAPGALISIYGSDLTSGGTMAGRYATRVLGTAVKLNGAALPLLYVSPRQINAMIPDAAYSSPARLDVSAPGASPASQDVSVAAATPGVFAVVPGPQAITVWATGLGRLPAALRARVSGVAADVTFAGVSPEFQGLYQINIAIPGTAARGAQALEVGLEGREPFYSGRVELP